MSDQRRIWIRRAALMAVVGVIVAVPVTIAVRGDEDSGEAPIAGSDPPEVGAVEIDRKLGIELRAPEGWKREEREGAVTFSSDDRSVLIALSAPGPADQFEAIQGQAVAAIEAEYRGAEVLDQGAALELGGRPASSAVLSARQPESGTPLRILVSTARGEKRAYLVEVFAAGANPGIALVEAQTLLNNLRLTD